MAETQAFRGNSFRMPVPYTRNRQASSEQVQRLRDGAEIFDRMNKMNRISKTKT